MSLSRHAAHITLSGTNLSLRYIKEAIYKQTGIKIGANTDILQETQGIDVDLIDVTIDSCLNTILTNTWLAYKSLNAKNYIIYRKPGNDPARSGLFSGEVKNAQQEPLPGATVAIKGTGRRMATDAVGSFSIPNLAPSNILQVSFAGYFPAEIRIGDQHFLSITLKYAAPSLDEIVVEGYGHTTRRFNTGAIVRMNGEDIGKQPVGNVLAALEGRLPGLVVTQANGVSGSSFSMLVRGQHSIFQGNAPLIVVDGFPIPQDNHSLSNISSGSAYGLPGMSALNGFSPADIDNIEVLKDAEATAIYGSRGANGVVLITTKKGRQGRPQWSADLSIGRSAAVNTPKLLNSQQYAAMREEAIRNDSLTVDGSTAPDLVVWDLSKYTDFKKMTIGNTALYRNTRLAVSGGDTIFTYLVSGNEHKESRPFPGSPGDERLSAFASFRYRSGNKHLQVQSSTLYSVDDNHLPVLDPTQLMYLAPDAPAPFDSAGKFLWQSNGLPFLNIAAQQLNAYHSLTKNTFTHWEISYELLPGLSARASLGYNSVTATESSVEPIAAQDPATDPTGTYFGATTRYSGLIAEPQLLYTRKKGQAKWDLLAGITWDDQHSRLDVVTAEGYTADAYLSMLNKAQNLYTQDSSVLYLYEALFARAKLNLADKYIFSISGRRDGSSRFGPGREFGNFGSVGTAWLFQKEDFFRKIPFLSFGKLRASYGITGNDQIGDYQYAQSWNRSATLPYGGVQGVYPVTPDNPKFSWELMRKLETALELGAWQDRVFFSAAWYRDRSGNQLVYSLLPLQTGFQGVTSNLPVVVENTGWEFVLHTQQKLSPVMGWSSAFSLTLPRNRLLSFPGLVNSVYGNNLVVGRSINTIRAYQYTGVDPQSGLFRFRDLNGDGQLDDRDKAPGGNTDLKAYAGWNNEFSYKGWQLSVFVEARQQNGYDALLQLYRQNPPGMQSYGLLDNAPVEVLHRWQRPGDRQPLQRFTSLTSSAAAVALNDYINSDAQLRDASFIRVKTVALSYSLPPALLSKWHLQSCRLYLQGQNLLTFTHYSVTDPETQDPYALPPLRTLAAGIQLNL